jgi:hypothetical protein
MKFNYRKPAVAAAIVGGVLAVSGTAAFAYWTATGTGSGNAATANDSQPLSISQSTVTGALVPGASLPISGTVSNPNPFNVPFALTAAATVDSTSAGKGCLASWYTVSLPSAPTSVGAASGQTSATVNFSGSVAMTNVADTNQDACKGATVTVTYNAK